MVKFLIWIPACIALTVPDARAASIDASVDVGLMTWPFGQVRYVDSSHARPVAVSHTEELYWGYGGEASAGAGGDPADATTWARASARGQYGVSQSAVAAVHATQSYQAPTNATRTNLFLDEPLKTEVRAINFIPQLAILAGDEEDLTILGPVCRGQECGSGKLPLPLFQAGEGLATWSFFQSFTDYFCPMCPHPTPVVTPLLTATLTVRLTAAGFELVENSCEYLVWFPSRHGPCQPLQGWFVRDSQRRMGVWFDPQFLVGPSFNVQGPFELSYGAVLSVSGRFVNYQGLKVLFADPQELDYRYPVGFTGPVTISPSAAVPEPASGAAVAAAVSALAILTRRRGR
jgi:hypothetical protein